MYLNFCKKGEASSPIGLRKGLARLLLLMNNSLMQQPANDILLLRARLQLEEGRSGQALAILEGMRAENEKQQQEIAYFLGWCYVLDQRWDDALRVLSPFSLSGEDQDEQVERVARERYARSLLHLGYAAINLDHYKDAEQHLTKCLKVLRHKQLQRPDLQLLRIQAHYSLALTYSTYGFFPTAIHHYEQALHLFLYIDNDEELANIYYGLCATYRKMGQLSEAQAAGEKALHLYERVENRSLEGRMHNVLGHVAFQRGDLKRACDYFTEALAIAASLGSAGVGMVMANCEALAILRLAEGRFDEARRYSQRAQEMTRQSQDNLLRGYAYQVSGKVASAEAEIAEGERRQNLLEEAREQFKKAHSHFSQTQMYDEIAETLTLWAQVCEALGQSEESIQLWKSAYQTKSRVRGIE